MHGCSDFAARLPNFSYAACDGIGSVMIYARMPRIPRVDVFSVLLRGSIVWTRCNHWSKFAKNPVSNELRENLLQNAIETNISSYLNPFKNLNEYLKIYFI